MLNVEKHKEEILKNKNGANLFAVIEGTPEDIVTKCSYDVCQDCKFTKGEHSLCQDSVLSWLLSEEDNLIKLTDREHTFCKLFEGRNIWLARNSSGDTDVKMYFGQPQFFIDGCYYAANVGSFITVLVPDLGLDFGFLEEGEAISIDTILLNEAPTMESE